MHVAIIMDGNGRWAERRGLARTLGHQAGARAVRRVVEAAARMHVDTLTLYAFSSDNWSRPPDEVNALMRLLKRYLQSEAARCVEHGIRIEIIGRRDRIQRDLRDIIEQTERLTRDGRALLLRLAVDYSARSEIMAAAQWIQSMLGAADELNQSLSRLMRFGEKMPDVDLLIRTGGERRLSDFLLWECAYAELLFVDEPWPEFDEAALARALSEFGSRQRRFGGLPTNATSAQCSEAP
jgi:undecaprenyl diphosphate synthase